MDNKNLNEYSGCSYCFLFYKRGIAVKEHSKFLSTSEVEQLGIDNSKLIYIGTAEGNDYYAIGVNNEDIVKGYSVMDIGDMRDEVSENVFSLVLRGLHFINWLDKTKYCSCCGSKVSIEHKKAYIECLNCGNLMYPFINPCILVAVLKDDKILLAHSPHFPPYLYSTLAGFVEPGESLETCVKREVREEVGIEIKNIKYFGTHPWPFSNSIMIGFIAEHASGEIQIDNNEIEAADWFSLDDLPNIPEYKFSFARIVIDHLLESRKKQ